MSKKRKEYWTQGSELYLIGPSLTDPSKLEVIKVGGVIDISMPEPSRNEIDVTDFDEVDIEQSLKGLMSSSEISITCNYQDEDPGQIYVEEMEDSEEELVFVIGFSKGKGIVPVISGDGFTLPNTRGWCQFKGELSTSGVQVPKNAAMPFVFKAGVKTKPKVLRKGRVVDTTRATTPTTESKDK